MPAKTDPSHDFPPGVAAPARRALASVGITRVADAAKYSEAQLAQLHGMGPKALGILKLELKRRGKGLRKG
ncbi:MAG: DNA-binding protein [Gemmatimonadota bacterium]